MHRPCLLLQLLKLGDTIKNYISQDVQRDLDNTLSVYAFDPWNSLSQNVIDSSTVNEFKNKLDKEWRHIRFNVDKVY